MQLSQIEISRISEIDSGRSLGRVDFATAVEARVAEFQRYQLQPAEAVLLGRPNSIDFFVDLFSVFRMGAVAVPADPSAPQVITDRVMRLLKPRISTLRAGQLEAFNDVRTYPSAARLLLLTSGSTGFPRGILHSEQALLEKLAVLKKQIGPAAETTLCALPTFFGHGLVCNSLGPLAAEGHLYLAPSFTPALVSQLGQRIDEFKITFFSSTPFVWNLIEKFSSSRPGTSLQRVHCASAFLSSRGREMMLDWCGQASVWNVYGLTELLGWVGGLELSKSAIDGDVGKMWDAELRINGSEQVQLRSSFQMMGSMILNEETEAALKMQSAEDWIDTGDMGFVNSAGHLIIQGRHDFMINKGGLKVQPEEVESVALCHEAVEDVCCFAAPDPLWGETVALAVVTRRVLLAEELTAWLGQRLASYKVPSRIDFVAGIPRTARGKIDRRSLIDQCLKPGADEA